MAVFQTNRMIIWKSTFMLFDVLKRTKRK